jgi:DNA polymerase-3 subunit alpha
VIYGLGAVRGVGEGPISALVESRKTDGPFTGLSDLCARLDGRKANRRVLEALIRSGAMDEFGQDEDIDQVRARLLAELSDAMQSAEQAAQNAAAGVVDMFGGLTGETPVREREVPPLDRRERLEFEKDALGLYLTGHPIEEYLPEIEKFCSARLSRLRANGRKQTIAGQVFHLRTMKGRRGMNVFLQLDDGSDRIEAAVYAEKYEAVRDKISKDAVLVLEGKVTEDDFLGALKMEVENVLTMDEARRRYASGLEIDLGPRSMDGDLVGRLRSSLEPHRGPGGIGCPVAILCQSVREDGQGARGRVTLGPDWRVNPSDDLLKGLRREFGEERVSLSYPSAHPAAHSAAYPSAGTG